jgi:hypothetical protein
VEDVTLLGAVVEGLIASARIASARVGRHDPALLRRMEDVLARGYCEALWLDAARRQLERRIEACDDSADSGLDALEAERRSLDGRAAAMRDRLGALRDSFVALGGTRTHGR